jgi:hypothetical protein
MLQLYSLAMLRQGVPLEMVRAVWRMAWPGGALAHTLTLWSFSTAPGAHPCPAISSLRSKPPTEALPQLPQL